MPAKLNGIYDLGNPKDIERLYLKLADRMMYEHEDQDELVRKLLKNGQLFHHNVMLKIDEEDVFIIRHLKQMARVAIANFWV